MKSVIPVDASRVSNYVRNVALYYKVIKCVVNYVLNLNMQIWLGKKEETKCE